MRTYWRRVRFLHTYLVFYKQGTSELIRELEIVGTISVYCCHKFPCYPNAVEPNVGDTSAYTRGACAHRFSHTYLGPTV